MSGEETRSWPVLGPPGGEGADAERRSRRRDGRLPALTILAHPDPARVGDRVLLPTMGRGGEVRLARGEPGFAPPAGGDRRPLDDSYVSRSPVLLRGLPDGGVLIDLTGTRTRVVVDGGPPDRGAELAPARLDEGAVLELGGRVALLLHWLPPDLDREPPTAGLAGDSEAINRVRHEIRQIADLDVPVLLRGETGSGKELVARAIHQASRRRDAVWLSVNLAALPPTLAASELFGAVRGAFTGAVQAQLGYFQRADGGTLLLDEIGETPGEVQLMLLRVLELGEVQRLGAQIPQKVDVRLIAATDADLGAEIDAGRFRAPLLHRLASYEIDVPPLRERRDDVGRLLYLFLREELEQVDEGWRLDAPGPDAHPWLPASIVARLVRHPWPGNVRQLRNVARHLVIGSRGSSRVRITPQVERILREAGATTASHATPVRPGAGARADSGGAGGAAGGPGDAAAGSGEPAGPAHPGGNPAPAPARRRRTYRSPSEVSEDELIATLKAHGFRVQAAAAALRVSRPALYLLIDACPALRKASELERDEIETCRRDCDGDLEAMAARLEVSPRGLRLRMTQLGIGRRG
jgi:DNA-binding NtrC family response regulator